MKKLFLTLITIAIGLNSNAQLDDIIAKNTKARGGEEKLKKLSTVIAEATVNAQGMDMAMKVTQAHNRGFRMDMQIMGMDNYMVCNTKEGYSFFPVGGQKAPEKMPEDMVKNQISDMDLTGDLIDYKTKGNTLTYQGEEDVDGTMCYKILCVFPSKKEKRIFIDKETSQIIKEVEMATVNGKEEEMSTEYSNFQTTDGYTFPMNITSPQGPMKVKKYTVNTEVKDELFQLKK